MCYICLQLRCLTVWFCQPLTTMMNCLKADIIVNDSKWKWKLSSTKINYHDCLNRAQNFHLDVQILKVSLMMATQVFNHLLFRSEPVFGNTADWKTIIDYHSLSSTHSNSKNYHKLSCWIQTCPNYMMADDCQWWSMIVWVKTWTIVETIINYHDWLNGAQVAK